MAHMISRPTLVPVWALILLVILMLAGLPLAVWLDLRDISEKVLRLQADDLNSLITSVRNYYATNVVDRVLNAPGTGSEVVHNYRDIPGAIPIPATLSLELGKVVGEQQSNIAYRFVSDYPFKGRPSHDLDGFERDVLVSVDQVEKRNDVVFGVASIGVHFRMDVSALITIVRKLAVGGRGDQPPGGRG